MLSFIIDLTTGKPGIKFHLKLTLILLILILCPLISVSQENNTFVDPSEDNPANSAITYRNPVEYDLEYIFELYPDFDKINKNKDLKLWIPLPRELDSQKAVEIISVEPEPHATYVDPEHGNMIFFWDFGKESAKDYVCSKNQVPC